MEFTKVLVSCVESCSKCKILTSGINLRVAAFSWQLLRGYEYLVVRICDIQMKIAVRLER
jgi:hypothetical protein